MIILLRNKNYLLFIQCILLSSCMASVKNIRTNKSVTNIPEESYLIVNKNLNTVRKKLIEYWGNPKIGEKSYKLSSFKGYFDNIIKRKGSSFNFSPVNLSIIEEYREKKYCSKENCKIIYITNFHLWHSPLYLYKNKMLEIETNFIIRLVSINKNKVKIEILSESTLAKLGSTIFGAHGPRYILKEFPSANFNLEKERIMLYIKDILESVGWKTSVDLSRTTRTDTLKKNAFSFHNFFVKFQNIEVKIKNGIFLKKAEKSSRLGEFNLSEALNQLEFNKRAKNEMNLGCYGLNQYLESTNSDIKTVNETVFQSG